MSRWCVTSAEEARREAWSEATDRTDECIALIEERISIAGRVLDLGCGYGRLTVPLAKKHPQAALIGYDTSPSMLSFAAEYARQNHVINAKWSSEEIPACDAAFSMLVFQHLDKLTIFDYMKRLCKVLNGLFVFQFVEGDYHGKDDHRYDTPQIERMLGITGYKILSIEHGLMYPEWTWVTAYHRGHLLDEWE